MAYIMHIYRYGDSSGHYRIDSLEGKLNVVESISFTNPALWIHHKIGENPTCRNLNSLKCVLFIFYRLIRQNLISILTYSICQVSCLCNLCVI